MPCALCPCPRALVFPAQALCRYMLPTGSDPLCAKKWARTSMGQGGKRGVVISVRYERVVAGGPKRRAARVVDYVSSDFENTLWTPDDGEGGTSTEAAELVAKSTKRLSTPAGGKDVVYAHTLAEAYAKDGVYALPTQCVRPWVIEEDSDCQATGLGVSGSECGL